MASIAVGNPQVKNMVCCDNLPQMLRIAKERICSSSVEFLEIPIQGLQYD